MFYITGKENGILWDAENDQALIKFAAGKAETKDEAVAKNLLAAGYSVEGEFTADNPFFKMTVEQLQAYAAENHIDLGSAIKKKDIIARLQEKE